MYKIHYNYIFQILDFAKNICERGTEEDSQACNTNMYMMQIVWAGLPVFRYTIYYACRASLINVNKTITATGPGNNLSICVVYDH